MTAFESLISAVALGAYLYTWISISRIWKEIDKIRKNEIKHLGDRVTKLENR